jgi:hypothetical protein
MKKMGFKAMKYYLGVSCLLVMLVPPTYGREKQEWSGQKREKVQAVTPVPATYFGIHVHTPTNANPYSWPTVHFGAYRSWDNVEGVCWPAIQRGGPDSYDWTALDKTVLKAQVEGKKFLYTFGPSPEQVWAVIDSKKYSAGYCDGAKAPTTSNEPDHTRWKLFITKVVERYCGCKPDSHPTARIKEYEIWNEPSLTGANGHSTFYLPASGNSLDDSAQSMVELSRIAYSTIKAIDPNAIVVSPSATGSGDGLNWLTKFMKAGGAQYADVIGFHPYYFPGTPEQMGDLVKQVRSTVDTYAPGRALWSTEAGWSNQTLTDDESAGFVARAYLLNWANGARRLYWYAWDDQQWTSLRLTKGSAYPSKTSSRDVTGISPPGIAFDQVYGWIVGASVSCAQWKPSLWKCELRRPGGYRGYVLWTTTGTQSLALPASWNVKQFRSLAGNKKLLTEMTPVQIDIKPQLFETTNPR